MCMSTQKEEHHSRNMSSAHPQCRQRPGQEGSEGRGQRKGIHTTGEKINAICLSHHAFPKYISVFLSPWLKLYWGTLSYCPLVSPSSRLFSPNRTSLQSSTVYINLSHARISEWSTILINVSCFSAPPVQGIIHTQGPWDERRGFLLAFKEMATDLDRQSVCPPKDYHCNWVLLRLRLMCFLEWSCSKACVDSALIVVCIVLFFLL